jgi:hypothetical protein
MVSHYTSSDLQKIMQVKTTTASKIISELNAELKALGKHVIRGRVSRTYFEERYSFTEEDKLKMKIKEK